MWHTFLFSVQKRMSQSIIGNNGVTTNCATLLGQREPIETTIAAEHEINPPRHHYLKSLLPI